MRSHFGPDGRIGLMGFFVQDEWEIISWYNPKFSPTNLLHNKPWGSQELICKYFCLSKTGQEVWERVLNINTMHFECNLNLGSQRTKNCHYRYRPKKWPKIKQKKGIGFKLAYIYFLYTLFRIFRYMLYNLPGWKSYHSELSQKH